MNKRFCPKCGASITSGVFCEDCTVNKLDYTMPVVQVSEFNRVLQKGRWVHFNNVEDVIIKRVQEALGKKIPLTLEPFSFEPKPKEKIKIIAHGVIDDQEIALPVQLSYRQCDLGQKEKTGYYEGMLQIRNNSESVISFIDKELRKVLHKGIFITKIVERKNGVDMYLTDKSYLHQLARKIHERFGGTLKVSPKLFSRNHQTSKDIYRVNALVQLPGFEVGDVISFISLGVRKKQENKKIVLINKMGKIIQGLDLLTYKPVAFELRNTTDLQIINQEKTQVVAVKPSVQVLDPKTFQATTIENHDIFDTVLEVGNQMLVVQTSYGLVGVKKVENMAEKN